MDASNWRMAAKSTTNIPTYKRRRAKKGGFFRFLLKLVMWFFIITIGYVVILRFVPPPITATMIGDLFAGRGVDKDWMSLDEMDRDMVRAAIGAEDSKFCQHSGFDWDAIQDAAKRNASGGRIRGGSTISQQTAKNVFLWQGGGYFRKGMEAYFTFLIETVWGKRRIMEVYLNVAETGIGTYGANAGSMRYFGHDASAMSADEASRIAAILPLPKKRGAITPKGFTRRYGNSIEARIGVVARDGLDACVYQGTTAPPQKAPPKVSRPTINPGDEYETANPPPPEPSVDDQLVNEVISDPLAPEEPVAGAPEFLPETAPPPEPVEPSVSPPAGNEVGP
jgi:monofunctional biosynthetic peptidoglycan transglycosylase